MVGGGERGAAIASRFFVRRKENPKSFDPIGVALRSQ
jgi:hypothetical protein